MSKKTQRQLLVTPEGAVRATSECIEDPSPIPTAMVPATGASSRSRKKDKRVEQIKMLTEELDALRISYNLKTAQCNAFSEELESLRTRSSATCPSCSMLQQRLDAIDVDKRLSLLEMFMAQCNDTLQEFREKLETHSAEH